MKAKEAQDEWEAAREAREAAQKTLEVAFTARIARKVELEALKKALQIAWEVEQEAAEAAEDAASTPSF